MPEAQENPTLFDLVDDPIATDKGSIYDYEASLGEYMSAAGSRAMDTNPVQLMLREGDFLGEDLANIAGKTEWVNADTARKEVTDAQLELKVPDNGISRFELDTLKYLKRREVEQFQTMARRSGPLTSVAGFGAGLAASAADPLNAASAFIPLVPEWRYASWLAKASGFGERTAIRAGVGALEGGVGAALIEPFVYAGATDQQLDYSLADSFMNVAFGTALGGGLHTIGGSAFDTFNAKTLSALREMDASFSRADMLARVAPDGARMDALSDAVRSLENDVPVRADGSFADYGITDREFANQSYDFSPEQTRAARAAVVIARVGDEGEASTSLLQTIRAMGGVKVRDANGQLTREGAEILAVLGDTRMPGLINNKRGVTADYLREALTEDGWFRSKDTAATDIQELYDVLDAAARGEKPQRYGETRGASVRNTAMRELSDAGVKDSDSVSAATMKVAEHRAAIERERMAEDPDFEPMEITYREEPGDGEDLAGPVTDEMLSRYEPDRQEYGDDPIDVQASRLADEGVAKSGEDLKTVAEDVQFLDQQIEGLKTRELWTKEDDAALAQGDEAAKAFEKEASIYRAAAVCMMEG